MNNPHEQFIKILETAKLTDFVSYRYATTDTDPPIQPRNVGIPEFMPTKAGVVAHLKLLRAFSFMKKTVVPDFDDTTDADPQQNINNEKR
ncbi:hypothetical protein Cantr_06689 [Candida viswanathii]|uniref:Uncharacterized protein n=1 Tax=Candida viswanathii TaxID=5486 RepID=A0A367XX58_9ASCO|nr:hypothetical protein Cantr_06689 [Candida viswanathii]